MRNRFRLLVVIALCLLAPAAAIAQDSAKLARA